MTIVKNHKRYERNGETYFREMYADKPDFVWLWRYGVLGDFGRGANARVIKDNLLSRPNIKRLFAK